MGDAREECGRKDADGASAGVAHDSDARPIDIVAGFEEVESAVDIEDTLTDQRPSKHQSLHGGVVTRMGRHPLLMPFATFAERSLLDAKRADAACHALQAKVSVALDFHCDGVVVAFHRDRMMHPGGVALYADEERVRRRRVGRQAEISEDIGSGFAAEDEFFDRSVFVVSFPEGSWVEGDSVAVGESYEFANFGS